MDKMVWVDYLIIGIICLSTIVGLLRGFIREAFSLVIWILAFWVGWTFFRELEVHLVWFDEPFLRTVAAFTILFLCTLILGALINYIVGKLVDKSGLSGTDRLIGMLFGIVRGAVLVAIMVVMVGLTPMSNGAWWDESQLIGHFSELAVWLRDQLPPDAAGKFQFENSEP
jgi:membrane protein required for colicin V production